MAVPAAVVGSESLRALGLFCAGPPIEAGNRLTPDGDARSGRLIWLRRRGSLTARLDCVLVTVHHSLLVAPVISLILLRSSYIHPAPFGLGSEGSAGHTSPVLGTKGAAVFGLGTSGHADTHHRSGCAVRRGRGQAVTLHRGFAPLRDLAAPRHALRWPGVGGCGWSCPASSAGKASGVVWLIRVRPSLSGGYCGEPMSQSFGAAPGPCHPHAAQAAAMRLEPECARTTPRAM